MGTSEGTTVTKPAKPLPAVFLVGKAGFEPAASASRTLKLVFSTPLRTQKPQVTRGA
jgi:hypothetical protein